MKNQPTFEPRHDISNNVVCETSEGSDQPAHMCSLIRAFASPLNILWVLSYWPNSILEFLSSKGDWTGSSESTLFKIPHCWKSRGYSFVINSRKRVSSVLFQTTDHWSFNFIMFKRSHIFCCPPIIYVVYFSIISLCSICILAPCVCLV